MGDRPATTIPPSFAADLLDEIRAVSHEERARFAAVLVSARQRSGRSLDEISRTTKISPRYLEALERGDVQLLPAGVYRRAILRDYAKAVGLEPVVAAEQFARTFGPAAAQTTELVDERQKVAEPIRATRAARSLPPIPASLSPSLPSVALGVVLGAALTTLIATIGSGSGERAAGSVADPVAAAPADAGAPSNSPAPGATQSSAGAATSGVAAAPQADTVPPADSSTRLVITSTPAGARVTVDGIGWGLTPLTIRHLPPGEKVVRVTKDGYLARERRVRVAGSAALRVTLRPSG